MLSEKASVFMKLFQLFFVFFIVIGLSSCQTTTDNGFYSNDKYTSRYKHPQYEYVKTAHSYHDWNEVKNRSEIRDLTGVDPVVTEWCAAFVNAVLKQNNTLGSESVNDYPLTARSFMFWGKGVSEPRIGDIVIFPRGDAGWQGHVGFYVETRLINDIDYYVILGGNQEDKVSYELYPAYKAISVRRSVPVLSLRPSQSE